MAAAAQFGLAPLNGSAPAVGAVFGYAVDHVRAMDVVTVDGRWRRVTAASTTTSRGPGAPGSTSPPDTGHIERCTCQRHARQRSDQRRPILGGLMSEYEPAA